VPCCVSTATPLPPSRPGSMRRLIPTNDSARPCRACRLGKNLDGRSTGATDRSA
jgi:hypothetical protein